MKIIKVLSKLQCLMIIGIIGLALNIKFLKLFLLFGFFGVLQLPILFNDMKSTGVNEAFKLIFQNFKMLFAMPLIVLFSGFKLPNKNNYLPKCYYSLPFDNI